MGEEFRIYIITKHSVLDITRKQLVYSGNTNVHVVIADLQK